MFLEYYGLREQPFGVTPDPRFIYFGPAHREALASLLYAIETKRGFSAIVAEPGMGKTSLLFHLLQSVRDSARTAFLFQTNTDSKDLLRVLLTDLGINTRGKTIAAMHDDLNKALLEEAQAGRRMIVVIDEAQNLDEDSLESVRLLSNFETSTEKLMHIVLAGQPKLAEKLASADLIQLRQRVSAIIRLEPFAPAETAAYIQYRLQAAGRQGPEIFSRDALDTIARVSKGIPRNINSICFQALSIGFATNSREIGLDILQEAVADLDLSPKLRRAPSAQPAASAWPPAWPTSPQAAAVVDRVAEPPSLRVRSGSAKIKVAAGFSCILLVVALALAFGDPSLGLTKTAPGRISSQVVNAVLSSGDTSADFLPAPPSALKPPSAPQIEPIPDQSTTSATAQPDSQSPDDLEETQAVSAVGSSERKSDVSSSEREASPATARYGEARYSTAQEGHGSFRVQVERRENIFEFALEHLGKSNLTIVEEICELNPQNIRGPYDMLSSGEWIELPGERVASTEDPEARSTRRSDDASK
jgi:general secretion pathway protein A